jgi:hypothetical protein
MPFISYADLQTSVGRWLKRTNLNDSIPDFIALAEVKLNNRLRVRQMRTSFSVTPTQPFITLPGNYQEAIKLTYGTTALDFLSENLATIDMNQNCDVTQYTIAGNQIWLLGVIDSTSKFTMSYYAAIEALSTTNTSNWLLEDAPNIYLYAALIEAEPFIKNDQRIAMWVQMLQSALDDIESNDDSGQHSGSSLTMRAG